MLKFKLALNFVILDKYTKFKKGTSISSKVISGNTQGTKDMHFFRRVSHNTAPLMSEYKN